MENSLLKTMFGLSLAIFLCSSCTRSASLTVLQPAQMRLPEHIAKVAVVDRSKPSSGWLNVLEGILTGEAIGQDRQSRSEAVQGLTTMLTRTPRFQVIRTGIEMTGSKAGNNLPQPLAWSEVERICADYSADALVTIESFDSDNSTSSRKVETKRKDKNGKQYIDVSYRSNQRTSVRIGWRMYDPVTKIILDEYVTDDHLERDGSGSTERAAMSNLPSAVSVTRLVAASVGKEYGARIAPVYVNVSRNYYVKAKGFKDEMKQAASYASGNDWKRAAGAWKKIAEPGNPNPKSAGRAAYNMAVAAEMSGNLDLALEWARKAYSEYGNKKARNYIDILLQRQNDARKVESQMNTNKV